MPDLEDKKREVTNMDRTARKREKEKKMVSEMIALYCRKKHHTKGGLCSECTELKSYVVQKRSLSVYGNEDILLELQSALLQTANAGENP